MNVLQKEIAFLTVPLVLAWRKVSCTVLKITIPLGYSKTVMRDHSVGRPAIWSTNENCPGCGRTYAPRAVLMPTGLISFTGPAGPFRMMFTVQLSTLLPKLELVIAASANVNILLTLFPRGVVVIMAASVDVNFIRSSTKRWKNRGYRIEWKIVSVIAWISYHKFNPNGRHYTTYLSAHYRSESQIDTYLWWYLV